MPRMYWLILKKVHAAVPVSQLFLASPKVGASLACHHLAVNVGFGAVDLRDVLDVGGAGLAVDRKGAVAVAQRCLSAADPRVVVAEDTGVLLVSRRIAGDLAQIQLIAGVGRLMQHDTVLGVQPLLHAGKRLRGLSAFPADARHDAHALRLDEDLTLGALLAAQQACRKHRKPGGTTRRPSLRSGRPAPRRDAPGQRQPLLQGRGGRRAAHTHGRI